MFIPFRYDACWLADPYIWGFTTVVAAVIAFNTFVILYVIKQHFSRHGGGDEVRATQDNTKKVNQKLLRMTIIMGYSLGIPWMVGFFNDLHVSAQYIFIILTLSAGIVILVMDILTNAAIKEALKPGRTRKITITSTSAVKSRKSKTSIMNSSSVA